MELDGRSGTFPRPASAPRFRAANFAGAAAVVGCAFEGLGEEVVYGGEGGLESEDEEGGGAVARACGQGLQGVQQPAVAWVEAGLGEGADGLRPLAEVVELDST